MNKLYCFTGNDGDSSVFIGAENWHKARNLAIFHECMDCCDFVDIRGSMCKQAGKPVHTKLGGEHDADDLMAAGYTGFWWSGDCAECGNYDELLSPVNGKLICLECEDPEED